MATEWHEVNVRRRLRGQRAVVRQVEEERVRYLLRVTPKESLDTYLQLHQVVQGHAESVVDPSPLLVAMRRLLDRFTRQQDKLA